MQCCIAYIRRGNNQCTAIAEEKCCVTTVLKPKRLQESENRLNGGAVYNYTLYTCAICTHPVTPNTDACMFALNMAAKLNTDNFLSHCKSEEVIQSSGGSRNLKGRFQNSTGIRQTV